VSRAAWAMVGAVLAGCGAPAPRPPTESPGAPAVEVRQAEGEPIVLVWSPPEALWAEVRHAETGRVVWRATAGGSRLGPRAALLRSPLAVAAMGPSPGVHPPDGRGAEASAPEALVPGARYGAVVAPCPPPAPGEVCGDARLQYGWFVAGPP